MDWTIGLLCGIGLAAACGFRVFMPLLGTSLAGMGGYVELSHGFDWMASPVAVIAFATATVLEIAAYYVPWLDNLLDVAATPAAVIAGTILTASMISDISPFLKWTLAIIAGGGVAGAVKGGTAVLRGASTLGTGGTANPVLSTMELISSAVMTVLAVMVPVIAFLLLLLMVWTGFWIWRRGKHARAAAEARADQLE
jgi:hypothetical protein